MLFRRRLGISVSISCFLTFFLILAYLVFSRNISQESKKKDNYDTDNYHKHNIKPVNDIRPFEYDFIPEGTREYHYKHWKKDLIDRPIELVNLTAPRIPSTATLIVIVPVIIEGRGKRDNIRNLWASKTFSKAVRDEKIAVLFLIADRSISDDLKEEINSYKDILIVYGFEEYRRLTYKLYFGYRWVSHFYPHMDVAKVDSDVVVITDNLYNVSVEERGLNNAIGFIKNVTRVDRNLSSKWYISESAFGPNVFPPFLLGFTYILKSKALAKIVMECSWNSIIEIEDTFFTGIIASRAGVKLVHNDSISYYRPIELKCDKNGLLSLISFAQVDDLKAEYQWLQAYCTPMS